MGMHPTSYTTGLKLASKNSTQLVWMPEKAVLPQTHLIGFV